MRFLHPDLQFVPVGEFPYELRHFPPRIVQSLDFFTGDPKVL